MSDHIGKFYARSGVGCLRNADDINWQASLYRWIERPGHEPLVELDVDAGGGGKAQASF